MHMPFAEILFFLFIVWVVIRLIARAGSSGRSGSRVGLPPYPAARPPRGAFVRAPRDCPDPRCRHQNPPHARFCARCGRRLAAEEKGETSMWAES